MPCVERDQKIAQRSYKAGRSDSTRHWVPLRGRDRTPDQPLPGEQERAAQQAKLKPELQDAVMRMTRNLLTAAGQGGIAARQQPCRIDAPAEPGTFKVPLGYKIPDMQAMLRRIMQGRICLYGCFGTEQAAKHKRRQQHRQGNQAADQDGRIATAKPYHCASGTASGKSQLCGDLWRDIGGKAADHE